MPTRLLLSIGVLLAGMAAAHAELTVASIQIPVDDHMRVNLDRIGDSVRQASEAGARVAVFPETVLSGFTAEAIGSLDWAALAAAERQLAELAAKHQMYLIYGSATPREGGKPFNTGVVVGPDGNEIERYHKMFPESWFAKGDHLALFEVDGVPCTMIVCHDSRFPELVRIPVLAGARVCFYISYEINRLPGALRKQEGYRAQLICRAVENGVWMVQSNGIGPLGESSRKSLGFSRIVDPGGVVVAEAPGLEEAMLVETIDPERAHRGNAQETAENPFLMNWYRTGMGLIRRPVGPRCAWLRPAPEAHKVTLALMQQVPVKWDLDANFDTFLRFLDEAGDADIFITPECWLDGYAAPDDASTPEKLREVAQPLEDSPYLDRVAEEARKRELHICFGFSSVEEGNIYNAAGLWNDQGELVGVYHKTHLQTHDLQYSPGMDLPVFSTPWGPVGIMICADRRWPETARVLRLKGARLILNPTYGMHHLDNEWWMRTRGYENQCFIAFSHPQVGFVVNPHGDLVHKRADQPGVMTCTIDLREAKDDNHIRDRRPDLYGVLTRIFRQRQAAR